MSKILEATCAGGVVTADGLPVSGATVLSEGVAPSSGILIMQGDEKTYVAKTSPDLNLTLARLAEALGNIATALTALDAKPIGALPPAPSSAAAIANITSIQGQLTALKEAMK